MSRRDVFASAGTAVEVPPRSAFRVTRLLRGDEAPTRGAAVSRRVIEVVQGLPAGCVVEITLGQLTARGNDMRIEVSGPAPDTFAGDLRWAFEGVAEVTPTRAATPAPPRFLAELRAQRSIDPWAVAPGADLEPSDPVQAELLRQRSVRLQTPWPRARYADLAELLLLNEGPRRDALGLVLRYRLAPAGPIEQAMAAESVHHSWDPAHGDAHEYLGRAVRLRVFVGSTRGPLPGRVNAIIGRWANSLDLVDLPAEEIETAWSGPALSLAGHHVPLGHAMALVRVPVATESFPGMATAEPPVELRPLDPVPPAPRDGVRLGRARTASGAWTDVVLDLADLQQHCFVQGASGSGKSTLLAAIALAVQATGASYTLLDPEGSTVEAILRQTDRTMIDRVAVVRHGHDELDAPLNLLAADPENLERTLDLFAEMIQRAQDPENKGMVGPRWRRWFSLIALATVAVFGKDATLVTVAAIASDMDRVRKLGEAVKQTDPELAHRILSEYGKLGGENAADMVSWGVSKLGMLLTSEKARWIFGAGPDAVDVRSAMDEGLSLLIDLGAHRLGEPVGRIIGATYLLKFWAALAQRRHPERKHYIIVDEAHLFSYGPLPKLLAEARKFGVGIIAATQHIGQLTGELGDALESNTGSFLSLRSGLHSASRASTRLEGWPVSELVRQPTLTAAATLTRDGIVTRPFSLEIDHHARIRKLERGGRVGVDVADQIVAACRTEVTASYAGLQAPTDEKIMARLTRPAPRPRDPFADIKLPPSSSMLDDWLDQRARRGAASDDLPEDD